MADSDKESKRHFGLSRNIAALSVLSLRKFVGIRDWISDRHNDSTENAALVLAFRAPSRLRAMQPRCPARARK